MINGFFLPKLYFLGKGLLFLFLKLAECDVWLTNVLMKLGHFSGLIEFLKDISVEFLTGGEFVDCNENLKRTKGNIVLTD